MLCGLLNSLWQFSYCNFECHRIISLGAWNIWTGPSEFRQRKVWGRRTYVSLQFARAPLMWHRGNRIFHGRISCLCCWCHIQAKYLSFSLFGSRIWQTVSREEKWMSGREWRVIILSAARVKATKLFYVSGYFRLTWNITLNSMMFIKGLKYFFKLPLLIKSINTSHVERTWNTLSDFTYGSVTFSLLRIQHVLLCK